MLETGLHAIYRAGGKLHFAVDVKDTYAVLAVFEICLEGEGAAVGIASQPWTEVEAALSAPLEEPAGAGFTDLFGNGVFVPDLPGVPFGGIYKGRSSFSPDGAVGYDEIVDFSLIELRVSREGFPVTWRNRFASSAREKVDISYRNRAREDARPALSIYMPIAGPLSQTRMEMPCTVPPILLNGTLLAGEIDDATLPETGQRFKSFYFQAVPTNAPLVIAAGGTLEVPYHLLWNADGSPCAHAVRFKLEADAGYLPRRRSVTDAQGAGVFTVSAPGLAAGDVIKVKLNAEHYTAVGLVVIEVV